MGGGYGDGWEERRVMGGGISAYIVTVLQDEPPS